MTIVLYRNKNPVASMAIPLWALPPVMSRCTNKAKFTKRSLYRLSQVLNTLLTCLCIPLSRKTFNARKAVHRLIRKNSFPPLWFWKNFPRYYFIQSPQKQFTQDYTGGKWTLSNLSPGFWIASLLWNMLNYTSSSDLISIHRCPNFHDSRSILDFLNYHKTNVPGRNK